MRRLRYSLSSLHAKNTMRSESWYLGQNPTKRRLLWWLNSAISRTSNLCCATTHRSALCPKRDPALFLKSHWTLSRNTKFWTLTNNWWSRLWWHIFWKHTQFSKSCTIWSHCWCLRFYRTNTQNSSLMRNPKSMSRNNFQTQIITLLKCYSWFKRRKP